MKNGEFQIRQFTAKELGLRYRSFQVVGYLEHYTGETGQRSAIRSRFGAHSGSTVIAISRNFGIAAAKAAAHWAGEGIPRRGAASSLQRNLEIMPTIAIAAYFRLCKDLHMGREILYRNVLHSVPRGSEYLKMSLGYRRDT